MSASCIIGGAWVATAATFKVADPATRNIIGVAADAEPELASSAIEAAHSALP